MGFIDFTNGEVLTADQMDTVLRQSVMKFADATARDTALSAVLAEGMMCYLDDTNEVLKYDGSSWIDISGDITGVTAGTALTGGGTSGNVTLDVDTAAVGTAIGIDDKQDNVITTQGDLVIGDASGDPVRLPVGTADQVLTSDGTTVSFQDAGGGGSTGWTEIVSSTSITGAASFEVTGLSGYSDYMIFVSNASSSNTSTDFIINEINGASISVISAQSNLHNDTSGNIKTQSRSDIQMGRHRDTSSRITFVCSIFGAGDTDDALFTFNGGASSSADNDETFIGNGLIVKSAAFSAFTIFQGGTSISTGTVQVFAR